MYEKKKIFNTMNLKSPSFKFLLILIVLIPISISVFAQKNKVLIVSDTWPEMDVLADGLKANGYLVSKANEEELQSDLSSFDFHVCSCNPKT